MIFYLILGEIRRSSVISDFLSEQIIQIHFRFTSTSISDFSRVHMMTYIMNFTIVARYRF